ncbi:MAG TPA: VOC family protein [Herpetosiphonaceae bacterium]
MPRVVHFEITANDPEQANRFYSDVFGWKIEKWDGPAEYWLISTGGNTQPGIDGGLMRREPATTINTIDVPSVDEYVDKIVASGGKVVEPKMAIPGIGYLAYCTDPEGNMFGIMENDPSAQ